jgi:threonine dehydratase
MILAQQIRSTYRIIGPHIRRTPIIEVDGADLVVSGARYADALAAGRPVDAEAGGAVALAALTSRRYVPAPNERIAVLICGGNSTAVDFER